MRISKLLLTPVEILGMSIYPFTGLIYLSVPGKSYFDSIPATFWFVIVTITTTGYGDIVPATFIGKLVTFPAMVFGVLVKKKYR